MKIKSWILLIVSAIFQWGVALPLFSQTQGSQQVPRTVTVVGFGEVHAKPDVARVQLGIEVTAETVQKATAANDRIMKSVFAALSENGIAPEDVQTTNYNLRREPQAEGPAPRYPRSNTPQGYRLTNMVMVVIRNLDSLGSVLDAATEAGANNIWGIQFSIDDPKAYIRDARRLAVADAAESAAGLAELVGRTAGEVLSISEAVGDGYGQGPMLERTIGGSGGIAPGLFDVSVRVQVTYALK